MSIVGYIVNPATMNVHDNIIAADNTDLQLHVRTRHPHRLRGEVVNSHWGPNCCGAVLIEAGLCGFFLLGGMGPWSVCAWSQTNMKIFTFFWPQTHTPPLLKNYIHVCAHITDSCLKLLAKAEDWHWQWLCAGKLLFNLMCSNTRSRTFAQT